MKIGVDCWKGLFRREDGNDLDISGLRGRASQDPNVNITLLLKKPVYYTDYMTRCQGISLLCHKALSRCGFIPFLDPLPKFYHHTKPFQENCQML